MQAITINQGQHLMSLKIIPIPALTDNYIWMFFDEPSKNAWVIDPGQATPVFEKLKQYHLHLQGIFITHHHRDHSGGVMDLFDQYPHIAIYGSYKSSLPFITHFLRENDEIACANITFRTIEIPGHTLDHTAFYGNDWLFSGDALFSAGCGKVFEGTPEQMHHSLQKLMALPDYTHVFCGHEYTLANLYFAQHVEPHNTTIAEKIKLIQRTPGPTLPSTLLEEKQINPFLRCSDTSIIEAVEIFAGCALKTPAQVFEKLRAWKNQFRA